MNDLILEMPDKPTRVWELDVPIVKNENDYTIYLDRDITEPQVYSELLYTLKTVSDNCTITLVINTPGGALDSSISIISAIKQCKAKTIAHVTGSVASAGTMIATACDELVVDDHSSFMVHTYSTQTGGKGQEVKAQQLFMEKSIKLLMEDVYAGFLTKPELKKLLNGEDFWFNKAELLTRWDKRQKYLGK